VRFCLGGVLRAVRRREDCDDFLGKRGIPFAFRDGEVSPLVVCYHVSIYYVSLSYLVVGGTYAS